MEQALFRTQFNSSLNPVHYDCLIVGAGVIGLMSALTLADQGMSVLIIDRQTPGQAASWAGGGILSALQPWQTLPDVLSLIRCSVQRYPAWIKRLQADTQIDPQYWSCGAYWVEEDWTPATKAFLKKADHEYQWCQPSELPQGLHPDKRQAGSAALYLPTLATVRNPRLLQALIKAVMQHNQIDLLAHIELQKLDIKRNTLVGVHTHNGYWPINRLVMCAGAWSGHLLRSIGLTIDVEPVKGQMLLFAPPRDRMRHVILQSDCYLIPRQDGQVLVGSTVERCGFDVLPKKQAYHALYQQAIGLWPTLQHSQVLAHWSGVRPGTPNGVPLIGAHSQIHNLYLNTGHFRYGLTLGPESAHRLAKAMVSTAVSR